MDDKKLTVKEPGELLAFLMGALSNPKRTTLKQWLKFRRISVNGHVATRHDHPLKPGDDVRINLDKHFREVQVPQSAVRVCYEDDYLIVINKPPGMLSLPDEAHETGTAYNEVMRYLIESRDAYEERHSHRRFRGGARLLVSDRDGEEEAEQKKGHKPIDSSQDSDSELEIPDTEHKAVRVHVVHRLDKHTSGLLIFAKTPEVRAHFLDNWRTVEKRYLAVVRGVPDPKSGVIRSHLAEDEDLRVRSVPESEDSRPASTRYHVMRWNAPRSHALVECVLETGRKNQIRVHMADIGHPVVGDIKYGVQKSTSARLALHAWRLSFTHPVTGKRIEVESELPEALKKLVDE